MSNKIIKNAEKGSVGLVVVSAATMMSKIAVAQGILSPDIQSEAVVVISGLFLGIVNILKHTLKEAIERRRARKGYKECP